MNYSIRTVATVAFACLALSSVASAQELAVTPVPRQVKIHRTQHPQLQRTAPRAKVAQPKTPAEQATTAPAAEEGPTAPLTFRWANEELYYSVRLNGVEAVRAGVRTGDVRYKEGHPYVAVSGTAQSTGIFHNIYPVNDRAHTYVHPETLRPVRSEKFFDEAGSVRSYHVDFVHTTYQARVRKEKDDRTRKFTKAIPGTTNDMITWFYELRNKRELKLGESMAFFIYDGWRLYKLEAQVVKTEDVYTPIGWFKTYKVDFSRTSLHTRTQKGESPLLSVHKPAEPSGSLWLSRDENLIPVKVAVNTDWGVGEAVLIKYKLPTKVD